MPCRALRLDFAISARDVRMPLILLVGTSVASLFARYVTADSLGCDVSSFTLGDNVALLFAGSAPFEARAGMLFVPPLDWLLAIMLVLYLPLLYPYGNLYGFGQHCFVRGQSRLAWWVAKCLWVALVACCGLGTMVAVAAAWTLFCGQSMSFVAGGDALSVVGIPPERLLATSADILPFALGACATVVALCLIQLTASLLFRPHVAYLGSLVYLIASCYAQSPLLLGGCVMVMRWGAIAEGGLAFVPALVVAGSLGCIAVVLGGLLVMRIDVADKEAAV